MRQLIVFHVFPEVIIPPTLNPGAPPANYPGSYFSIPFARTPMLDRIKKAANAVSGSVGDAVGAVSATVSDTVSSGFEKLQGPLNDLAATSEAMAKIGYRIGEIELEFTLPPRIIVHLHREASVHDEAFQAVLANNADNRTFCIVVALLRQTNRIMDRVQIKGRRLHEVEVSLGLIPSVKLKYAHE
jgi:hypothetical protein